MKGPDPQTRTVLDAAEPHKVALSAKKIDFCWLSFVRNAVIVGVKPMVPVAQKGSVVSTLRSVAQMNYCGLDSVQNLRNRELVGVCEAGESYGLMSVTYHRTVLSRLPFTMAVPGEAQAKKTWALCEGVLASLGLPLPDQFLEMPFTLLRRDVEQHWGESRSGVRNSDLLVAHLSALPLPVKGWGPGPRQAMKDPLMNIMLVPAVRPVAKKPCPRQCIPWVEPWPLQKKGFEGLPCGAEHIHLRQGCSAPHECQGCRMHIAHVTIIVQTGLQKFPLTRPYG
jgi:hypothetical protein